MKGAWQPLYSADGWSCCQQMRLFIENLCQIHRWHDMREEFLQTSSWRNNYSKSLTLTWKRLKGNGVYVDGPQAMAENQGGLPPMCSGHAIGYTAKHETAFWAERYGERCHYHSWLNQNATSQSPICFGKDLGSGQTAILFHSFSHDDCHTGRCCPGPLNCERKSTSFVKDKGRDLAHKSNRNKFLMNLAYLCGMFLKLSDVNVQLQATNTHLPHLADKITSFIRKLEMWLQRKRGDVDSFEKLKSFIEDNKLQNTVSPCMKADIAALQKDFQRYF